MHHWADMDAAVRELRRVLRPAGRIVLVDEDFADPRHVMARRTTSHNATYPMVDPERIAEILLAAGFDAHASRPTVAGRPLLQVTARAPA
jgi:SAM-dependent methyltransferase